jgi:L-ascorbate metabolism protein UlaG (beta-lactamase superfamily)
MWPDPVAVVACFSIEFQLSMSGRTRKMKRLVCSIVAVGLAAASAFAARSTDEFKTTAGTLKITTIQHAAFLMEAGGQTIYVDPAQGSLDGLPKADVILLTDIHGDHLAPPMIASLKKTGTTIIAPAAVAKTVTEATVLNNGESKTLGAWKIEAVPMYNLKRGPAPGQLYHDKGRGNGYIVTYGGLRIYIAGDTEGIPEMRALRNIDVAFIPMNLPYTMPPEEAAEAVKAFHPKVVYPYHYMGSDPKVFEAALKDSGIEVRLRNWY